MPAAKLQRALDRTPLGRINAELGGFVFCRAVHAEPVVGRISLVLGGIPLLYGLLFGVFSVFLYGIIMTTAASGDILVVWLIRNLDRDTLVQDHPDRVGCKIMEQDALASS